MASVDGPLADEDSRVADDDGPLSGEDGGLTFGASRLAGEDGRLAGMEGRVVRGAPQLVRRGNSGVWWCGWGCRMGEVSCLMRPVGFRTEDGGPCGGAGRVAVGASELADGGRAR